MRAGNEPGTTIRLSARFRCIPGINCSLSIGRNNEEQEKNENNELFDRWRAQFCCEGYDRDFFQSKQKYEDAKETEADERLFRLNIYRGNSLNSVIRTKMPRRARAEQVSLFTLTPVLSH